MEKYIASTTTFYVLISWWEVLRDKMLWICSLFAKVWALERCFVDRCVDRYADLYVDSGVICVIFVVHLVVKFSPTKISPSCVALSTPVQIWTGYVLLWFFFTIPVPHSQCPWYTGSPFSSCPACDGYKSEQRTVEGRSMTKENWASTSCLTPKSVK